MGIEATIASLDLEGADLGRQLIIGHGRTPIELDGPRGRRPCNLPRSRCHARPRLTGSI
jgi:hypothetical protein